MIDLTEIADGDAWEAFCLDYLVTKGLTVEVPPGRGASLLLRSVEVPAPAPHFFGPACICYGG